METNSRKKNDLCQSQLRHTNLGRLILFTEIVFTLPEIHALTYIVLF